MMVNLVDSEHLSKLALSLKFSLYGQLSTLPLQTSIMHYA